MPYEQGLSDWRVYSAEQAVGHDRDLTIEECRQLVEDAAATAWWREWFSNTAPINVVEGGDETPELELRSSYAQPQSYPRADGWTISLHPGMPTARVLLHELTHCVAPQYVVEDIGPRRRNGKLLVISHRQHLTHGPFFTAALAVITDNLLPGDNGELAAALAHFEARAASSDEHVSNQAPSTASGELTVSVSALQQKDGNVDPPELLLSGRLVSEPDSSEARELATALRDAADTMDRWNAR